MKKNKPHLQSIGILGNTSKVSSGKLVTQAAAAIRRSGRTVASDEATAHFAELRCQTFPSIETLARSVDLILVFGGDGTMLRVARELNGSNVPLLGINVGGLGFLTDVRANELNANLKRLWAGQYRVEERALIEASSRSKHLNIKTTALNDFVITRGSTPRLIELDVAIDSEILTRYRADGLIVSSPTGSTAYSLSAGGAVVCPNAKVLTITPVCPHTLSNRSVIVSFDSTIDVTVLNDRPETILSADGQGERLLHKGAVIRIRRSDHSIRLVNLRGSSFFNTLRQKLHWSGSHV